MSSGRIVGKPIKGLYKDKIQDLFTFLLNLFISSNGIDISGALKKSANFIYVSPEMFNFETDEEKIIQSMEAEETKFLFKNYITTNGFPLKNGNIIALGGEITLKQNDFVSLDIKGSANLIKGLNIKYLNLTTSNKQGITCSDTDFENVTIDSLNIEPLQESVGKTYGIWFSGINYSKIYIKNNNIKNTKYAIQINRQLDSVPSNPGYINDIYIQNNNCKNATIGINTPHAICKNVFIESNIVECDDLQMPINVAHAENVYINHNSLYTGSSSEYCMHLEDHCKNMFIESNKIECNNNGITMLNESNVSGDSNDPEANKSIITNNILIKLNNKGGNGICLNGYSNNVEVENNTIENFETGLITWTNTKLTNIHDNKFINCSTAINTQYGCITENNMYKNCDVAISVQNSNSFMHISKGETFINCSTALANKSNITFINPIIIKQSVDVNKDGKIPLMNVYYFTEITIICNLASPTNLYGGITKVIMENGAIKTSLVKTYGQTSEWNKPNYVLEEGVLYFEPELFSDLPENPDIKFTILGSIIY